MNINELMQEALLTIDPDDIQILPVDLTGELKTNFIHNEKHFVDTSSHKQFIKPGRGSFYTHDLKIIVSATKKELVEGTDYLIVGMNYGKTKLTENEHSVNDYIYIKTALVGEVLIDYRAFGGQVNKYDIEQIKDILRRYLQKGGGGGGNFSKKIHQENHGFDLNKDSGRWVYYNLTSEKYEFSCGDRSDRAAIAGIILSIPDKDNFELATGGIITFPSKNNNGYVIGADYNLAVSPGTGNSDLGNMIQGSQEYNGKYKVYLGQALPDDKFMIDFDIGYKFNSSSTIDIPDDGTKDQILHVTEKKTNNSPMRTKWIDPPDSSGDSVKFEVTLSPNPGFNIMDAVKITTDGWVRTKADNSNNAGTDGIISKKDGNKYEITTAGLITLATPKLTQGETYVLSPDDYNNGNIVKMSDVSWDKPGTVFECLCTAISKTQLLVNIDVGEVITDQLKETDLLKVIDDRIKLYFDNKE